VKPFPAGNKQQQEKLGNGNLLLVLSCIFVFYSAIIAMKVLQSIPSFLRNKFLITSVAFGVWMLFFDKNDFFAQMERKQELKELNKSKDYFTQQIEQERQFSEELKHNPATIEKFAREKYFMKRDGEDLFLVETTEDK
jgi:cell division protein DivIC